MSAFQKIEVEGAYRGTIVDSTAGKTRNGFPQAILRLRAEEAANDKGEFESLESPAQITSYMVLFNNNEVFNEQTANLNYGQLQKVGKWEDGKFSFREIAKLNGKKCFFRTQLNEYNGKTSMQVAWFDEYDSDGTTTLKPASDAELSAMDSMLKFTPSSTPAAPTARRGRPAKPTLTVEVEKKPDPTIAGSVGQSTATATVMVADGSTVTKAPLPAPPAAENPVEQLPAECTKTEAWEYIYGLNAGDDDKITEVWLKAIKEVGGNQQTYTPAQWAVVRDKARGLLIPY